MSVIKRIAKPTTRRGKKVLLSREPQLVEGPKRTLFLHGRKVSEKVKSLLKDIYNIKKPDAKILTKKNDITAFENANPLEAICRKHESPLFVFGSHNKKRPDNVTFGRMFDYNLLDMIELGLENYVALKDFPGPKITLGIKPCLVFNGELWNQQEDLKHLKSIFADMFHREAVDSVRLQGIEHAISFTASKEGVHVRSYRIMLKKSGCRTPRIELEEIGPSIDFTIRRSKLPSEDLMRQARKRPKELRTKVKKNVSVDPLGSKHGRIHVGKQNIDRIQVRKMKGLKKAAGDAQMGPPTKRVKQG